LCCKGKRVWDRGWAAIVAVAFALAPWRAAASLAPEVGAALNRLSPGETLPVIVSYRAPVDGRSLRQELQGEMRRQRRAVVVERLRAAAAASAGALLTRLEAAGARDVHTLWIAGAIALRAPEPLVRMLAADADVLQVRLDAPIDAPLSYAGAIAAVEWNLDAIAAPALWSRGFRGAGAVVASLDTGVDLNNPDLAAAWRGGGNSWFDPYGQHARPIDLNGHGTQVTGLMVAGAGSGSAVGVAPDAKWVAARVFNDAGAAVESAIHRALQWALDPDGDPSTDDAPDVVNASWDLADPGACNSAFQADIDALRAADIAVVFAAGNFGPEHDTSTSPANTGHVVSVGAVDDGGKVALFSSRGPSACDGGQFPTMVAPGVGVMTTDLAALGGSPAYVLVDGTSFAAPHVSGAIALLRGAAPLASVDQLEVALRSTAHDIGATGPDADSGYGLIDVAAALDALPPADADGDGYGVAVDCNDDDARVHPGAAERRRDGIDQDCNGYDLTIDVKYAVYAHDGSELSVRVSSLRGPRAALAIDGLGPMSWRPRYRDWYYRGEAGDRPRQIVVRGAEGAVTVEPRAPTARR